MDLKTLQHTYLQHLKNQPFSGHPASLYEPINYIMNLGGKRIRPVFALAASALYKDDYMTVLPVAHAIETFHNFTLVHDDIMDGANSRRGQDTVHIRNGLPTAILAGDNMLILSLQMLEGVRPDILKLFLKTAQDVCDGQQMDMEFETQANVSMAEYLEMIRLKTAVLLGCAAYVGAAHAGAIESDCQKLYSFGQDIGMAFQMQDDWLDTFGTSAQTGKIEGGDIIARKKMWLYIKAKETNSHEIEEIYAIENTEERVKTAQIYFDKIGVSQAITMEQNRYYENAIKTLTSLGFDDKKMQPFMEVASFLKTRNH
jgi:geranylgeranyl diphosphate synthase type II